MNTSQASAGAVSAMAAPSRHGPGRIDLFARGVDYGLHHEVLDGQWYDWHAQ